MPDPAGLSLELRSRSGTLLATSFENPSAIEWKEILDDTGEGRFELPLDGADAALIDYGQHVRCKIGASTVFGFLVEKIQRVSISAEEDAGRSLRASGRGLVALFEEAVVYPELGPGSNLSGPDRLFNFASPDFDDSAWGSVTTAAGPAVGGWPDTTSLVVWGPGYPAYVGSTPVGECYFRKTFTVTTEGTYRVFFTADDGGDVYVDGILVFSEVRAFLWQQTKYVDVFLEAGTHTLGVRGENITRPDPLINAAWIKLAVYEVLAGGEALAATPVVQTDATWKAVSYPTNPPGFTPGEVVEILLSEAQARGALSGISLGFTATNDSGGTPWPATPDITLRVGVDYLSVLRQLAEVFCSFRLDPVTLELEAFATLGTDRSATVELEAGVSLSSLAHDGSAPVANVVLARYPSGAWYERTSSGSVTSWGRKEKSLSAGAQSPAQIRRVIDATFGEVADPATHVTAAAEPLPGIVPWVDYFVGDWISAPGEDGTPTSYRVRAVTAAHDEAGHPIYVPELGTLEQEFEARLARLSRRMNPGSFSGRVENAAPPTNTVDNPLAGFLGRPEVAVFSYSGELAIGAMSGRFYPTKSVRRIRALASITPGTSSTVVTLYKNGVALGTITFTAGDDVEAVEFASTFSPNVDFLTAAITTAGAGAADLVVRAELS